MAHGMILTIAAEVGEGGDLAALGLVGLIVLVQEDVVEGELPVTLSRLARQYGIRYELLRYPVSVGFTMATSEAARRANGTYLFFLNNDAFVKRHALRALLDTFTTHADIGVVGAKLVGTDDAVQEAGAIIWADASGAWFNKYMPLYRGKRNDIVNHRLNYVRETDYVSAAVAMVPLAKVPSTHVAGSSTTDPGTQM